MRCKESVLISLEPAAAVLCDRRYLNINCVLTFDAVFVMSKTFMLGQANYRVKKLYFFTSSVCICRW